MDTVRFLFTVAMIKVALASVASYAEDITIFEMRKNITLSDDEPVYRDFYLSKGGAAGLRPGMILTVKRKIPLYNTIQNRSAGDLNVAVGRIKIIHVERDLAVARNFADFKRDDLPMLEDNYIMIGDEVDLSSATVESKLKGKSAAVESNNNEEKTTVSDSRPLQTEAPVQASVAPQVPLVPTQAPIETQVVQ